MNWENTDFSFEEEKETASSQNQTSTEAISTEEQEDDKAIQLKKFQNPATNSERQAYVAIADKFGEFLVNGQLQEIADNLMTEDCHSFLFNFNDTAPTTYSIGNQEFLTLYKGSVIIERNVKETHVDVSKSAVFQMSECKILSQDGLVTEQVCFDFFTLRDFKIVRYRGAFASRTEGHGPEDPFVRTNKAIMLAKVKELNYAFADKPDLEKIASLLQENMEYKMLDWDGQKVHTFHKREFLEGWKTLEEHYILKSIVPYEIYSERQFIVGTYVYYLESKVEPGKEYVWLSTSIYSFDRNLNISQVNQQGELYPAEDVEIPFQVFSTQKLENKVQELLKHLRASPELFYSLDVDFGCVMSRFGPLKNLFMGTFHGLKEIESLNGHVCDGRAKFEWFKAPDVFVDHHDPSYDVVIALICNQGAISDEKSPYHGKRMNCFTINRYSFENAKLTSMYQFFCQIPEPIPSPYDNPEFEGVNIIPRSYIV